MARQGLVLLLVATIGVAACRQEPTFDERFDAAQEEVEETVRSIDRDLETDTAAQTPATASPERGSDADPTE